LDDTSTSKANALPINAGECLNRSYAACACGTKPRCGPPAALPGGKQIIFKAESHHKREVNDFACGKNIGVGLRRPCRGQACGGMLGAMARIAPAWPTTRPTTHFIPWDL